MITAVIPVRSGSTRCKNKNIRDFNESNLLKMKIEQLKKVKNLDRILVSSNCDEMLNIAKNLDVYTHKRDSKYCTSECSGTDLYLSLANAVQTEHLLLTFCVTPFVKVETYEKTIDIYKKNEYDSVSTTFNFKHYIWHDNKPVNYNYDNAPPTQCLPDYYVPTYGINIVSKQFVLKNKNVISHNPYFYDVGQIESIDIDTSYEYILSELLHQNNIINDEIAFKILNQRDKVDSPIILDATLLDHDIKNINYVNEYIEAIQKSEINMFLVNINTYQKYDLLEKYNDRLCIHINMNEFLNYDMNFNNLFISMKNIDDIHLFNKNWNDSQQNIIINIMFDFTESDLELISQIKCDGIIFTDDGTFNEKNITNLLHKMYKFNNNKKYGYITNKFNLNKIGLFHGANYLIGSLYIDTIYSKTEEILSYLAFMNRYNIYLSNNLIEYKLNHICHKKNSFKHPYYIIGNMLEVSNYKISCLLNLEYNKFLKKILK